MDMDIWCAIFEETDIYKTKMLLRQNWDWNFVEAQIKKHQGSLQQ